MSGIARILKAKMPLLGAALLAILFILGAEALAATIRCSVCKTEIASGSRYIKSDGRIFCSKSCFDRYAKSKLPKCCVCGKQSEKGYSQDGKFYCSQKCLSTTWPKCIVCGRHSANGALIGGDQSKFVCQECAAKPRCFVCSMPGDWKPLDDGRCLCDKCGGSAVFDHERIAKIYDKVREALRSSLSLNSGRRPALVVLGLGELSAKSSKLSQGMEFGLFEYKATIETVTKSRSATLFSEAKVETHTKKTEESIEISVLYGVPEAKLEEVLAHELGHDWMQRFYPCIEDDMVKEGWAEFVAWQYNRLFGRDSMNKRIEGNKDKYYGDGFRMIKKIHDSEGMEGLKKLFRNSGTEE